MGKSIISQARGHGSLVYRVRRAGYKYRIKYPGLETKGKAKIINLLQSAGHSSPVMRLKINNENFFNLAFRNAYEGQEIEIDGKEANDGSILQLKEIPIGKRIYNIEIRPGDGGKVVRSGGNFAEISKKEKKGKFVKVMMPSKKEKVFDERCRATIGEIAGAGRVNKPILKAGRRFYLMRAKGKKWHFTSAVKMNAVDHPFGGGRGKRIKSKIAKRNAPPGAKVGHLRPRRTGRRR